MVKLHPVIKYPSIAIIVALSLLYFLSCLTPYISSLYFKGFTYLALLFPYLLIGMLLIFLISLILFRKYSLLVVLILLFGYKNIFSTTGFHYHKPFVHKKASNTFRLLSFNVNSLENFYKMYDTPNAPRRNILNIIKSSDADVMCFQDFGSTEETKDQYSNLKYLIDTLKYPYTYTSIDFMTVGVKNLYGTIILSKYPIIDSGRYTYARKHTPEHLTYATININGKLIRVYNTHLQSMFLHRYGRKDYGNLEFIKDDTAIIYTGHRYQKLVYFDSIHVAQAKLVKEKLNECKLPYIFCADLNSVPSSYIYQHISEGLKDAFLQTDYGWGTTYEGLSPTLRIDVVLLSKDFEVTQGDFPKPKNASDHFPIITDIAIH